MYFPFEPGDGSSYRVMFARSPGRGFVREYLIFGIAEGDSDPGCWFAFNTPRVGYESFAAHLFAQTATSEDLVLAAWMVWRALIGAAVSEVPFGWRADWRRQLPADAR